MEQVRFMEAKKGQSAAPYLRGRFQLYEMSYIFYLSAHWKTDVFTVKKKKECFWKRKHL
jgi:hypothetical protein